MLQIHSIPAFEDNYFWLIQPNNQRPEIFVVDPGAAEPVQDYLELHNLTLAGILLTHHHNDHIGGAAVLAAAWGITVYGPDSPHIPQVNHPMAEGDRLDLLGTEAKVMALPGHTLDHIAYYLAPPHSPPLLFSGDTLFAAGCGRLFDGTAEQLFASLNRIAALDDETLIYATHEYTLANLAFALFVEPDNSDLQARHQQESQKREQGLATLPTQLGIEKRTNPFLRCHLDAIRTKAEQLSAAKLASEADIFASLRRAKDKF
jgi:hydroxyacylglutathione hydrolase